MKLKAVIAGSILVVMSVMFAACGDADDGKITTTKAPASSAVTTTQRSTTSSTTTNRPIMDEMSSAAGDVSEGLSDAASELRSEAKHLFD